jgi:hypothetical protein
LLVRLAWLDRVPVPWDTHTWRTDRAAYGAAHVWRALPALALHHPAEYADQLGCVLELGVVHDFLCTIYVLDGATGHTARGIVVMLTVPKEGCVLERYRETERVRSGKPAGGVSGGGNEVRAG